MLESISACSRSGSDSAKLAADEHRTTRRVIFEPDAGREAVSPHLSSIIFHMTDMHFAETAHRYDIPQCASIFHKVFH